MEGDAALEDVGVVGVVGLGGIGLRDAEQVAELGEEELRSSHAPPRRSWTSGR